MTPEVTLRLVNLTAARKPDRGPAIHLDPLARPATAARALGLRRVHVDELGRLRELHETVVELVDSLLSAHRVDKPAARLTALARGSCATVRLEAGEHRALCARLQWSDPTPSAGIARAVALELGEIDVARLKRCERPACDLVFYDKTRSGTQRWHAESPCGNRERQRRHRAAH